jgi:hypothetical protein
MSFPLALTPAIKETNPMAKADPNSTTNTPTSDATSRRNFLTSAAGIAAGATAIAAVPVVALPDPIYSAIDTHRNLAKVCDLTYAAAGGAPYTLEEGEKIVATVRAEAVAARALIQTAPTTPAGLWALEAHLRDDRHSRARGFINLPVILDGGLGTISLGGPEAVDWFIAQRASEMTGRAPPRPLNVEDVLSAIRSAQARERRKGRLT